MRCGNLVFCDSICPEELTACKRYVSSTDGKETNPKHFHCFNCEGEFSHSEGQIIGLWRGRKRLQVFICWSCKFDYQH
jgi:hypothetical protein